MKKSCPFILILLAIAIAYANAINAPFLWDDEVMVVQNHFIHSLSNVTAIFTHGAFGDAYSPSKFYRPIQILSFATDYAIWGLNAWGFRLTSLGLFISAMSLLYLLCRRFFSVMISTVVVLFYAIHPMHIESVTYISGRGDVLNVLFASVILYVFFCKRPTVLTQLAVVLAFVLGVLSKENIIALPFVLLLYHYLFKSKDYLIATLSTSFLALSFALYRVLSAADASTLSWIASASISERIATLPYILVTYLKLLVFPYPLHMEYHTVLSSVLNGYSLSLLIIVFVTVYLLRRFKPKVVIFGILFFCIMLAPVHQVFFPLAATLREHWLALPAIGLLFVIGGLLRYCEPVMSKRHVVVGSMLIILIFSGLTINRNADWRSAKGLYMHDLKLEPRSFVLANNLGVAYFRESDINKAEYYFKQAIVNSPNHSYDVALNNYGVILEQKGQYNEAASFYIRSIRSGDYELAYTNLVKLALKTNTVVQFKELLITGYEKYPNNQYLQAIEQTF